MRADKSVKSLWRKDLGLPEGSSKEVRGGSGGRAAANSLGIAPWKSLQAGLKHDTGQQGPQEPLASSLFSLCSLKHKTLVLMFAPELEEQEVTQER